THDTQPEVGTLHTYFPSLRRNDGKTTPPKRRLWRRKTTTSTANVTPPTQNVTRADPTRAYNKGRKIPIVASDDYLHDIRESLRQQQRQHTSTSSALSTPVNAARSFVNDVVEGIDPTSTAAATRPP